MQLRDDGSNKQPRTVWSLLQKAYEQLSTRKQSIENEGLRGEHDVVTAQVAALDLAMKAFQHQPVRPSETAGGIVISGLLFREISTLFNKS